MKKFFIALVVAVATAFPVMAEGNFLSNDSGWYKFNLTAEAGFISVLSHTIQFGQSGTQFDYKEDGNQDVLFPFNRYTAELRLWDNHSVTFLYQPLDVVTDAVAKKDIYFHDVIFTEGTPMVVRYGFSFYRASYTWYFLKDKGNELGAGLSMQVRNASISFKSADGTTSIINENVGPVPILRIAGKYNFDNGVWVGMETDAFYASSEFFNGSKYPFEGAIWDASFRSGIALKNGINPFINLRFLGGGGKGTSQGEDRQGDGYTNNWLNTMSLTLGVVLE